MGTHHAYRFEQIRKLHRHRARSLQPHQLGGRRERSDERGHIHGVVKPVAYAPARQFAAGQILAGAIGVVGDQHLVTCTEQGQIDQRDRRQAAGHQQRLQAPFEGRDAFFKDVGGGRAQQSVAVACLVFPAAREQGLRVGKDDRGGLVDRRLHRIERRRRHISMVNERGLGGQRCVVAAGHVRSAVPRDRGPVCPRRVLG